MDNRLLLETARDRLDDWQQGLAHALDGAELPVETAAYVASAQRRVGEAIADIDRSMRYLAFDGAVQKLMAARLGGSAVVDGKTGAVVA